MNASLGNHPSCNSLLLFHGADISAVDNNGLTSLMWAAREGSECCISVLLDRGADICC